MLLYGPFEETAVNHLAAF